LFPLVSSHQEKKGEKDAYIYLPLETCKVAGHRLFVAPLYMCTN